MRRPGIEIEVDFVDVEGIPVRSNSVGARGGEYELDPSPERCRIVLLGDSFT